MPVYDTSLQSSSDRWYRNGTEEKSREKEEENKRKLTHGATDWELVRYSE